MGKDLSGQGGVLEYDLDMSYPNMVNPALDHHSLCLFIYEKSISDHIFLFFYF
jgi:hypothetical protein